MRLYSAFSLECAEIGKHTPARKASGLFSSSTRPLVLGLQAGHPWLSQPGYSVQPTLHWPDFPQLGWALDHTALGLQGLCLTTPGEQGSHRSSLFPFPSGRSPKLWGPVTPYFPDGKVEVQGCSVARVNWEPEFRLLLLGPGGSLGGSQRRTSPRPWFWVGKGT